MTVKFKNYAFPGTHGAAIVLPPELHVVRSSFFGLDGTSEIVGGRGGREITVDMWFHNKFFRRDQLINGPITTSRLIIGHHGKLELIHELAPQRSKQNGAITYQAKARKEEYEDVTFHGFFPTSFGGQPGVPLFDWAGTVDGGWFIAGQLRFYQLKSD
jgi:hypothetical protein